MDSCMHATKAGETCLVSHNQYKNARCVVHIWNFNVLNIWVEKGRACWAASLVSCKPMVHVHSKAYKDIAHVCATHKHTLYLFNI